MVMSDAAPSQRVIDGPCGEKSGDERARHADPVEPLRERGGHQAGNKDFDGRFRCLHHGDADALREKDDPSRLTEGNAAATVRNDAKRKPADEPE